MENITGKQIVEMSKFMSETQSEEDYQKWLCEFARDLEADFGYLD